MINFQKYVACSYRTTITIQIILSIVFMGSAVIASQAQSRQIVDSLQLELKKANHDSILREIYSNLSFHYSRINLDSAKIYADSFYQVSHRTGDKNSMNEYNYKIGLIEKNNGNNDKAYAHFTDFYNTSKVALDSFKIASVLFQLAIIDVNKGNLQLALERHRQAIDIYLNMSGVEHRAATHYNSMGIIYKNLKQWDKAEEFYIKSKDIHVSRKNSDGIANAATNLGNLYGHLKKYDVALLEFKEAVYHDSITNFNWGLGYDYENIGNLLILQKKYKEGELFLLKALRIRKPMKSNFEIAATLKSLGQLNQEQSRFVIAKDYYHEALEIAEDMKNFDLVKNIKHLIADCYAATGQYKKAFEYKNDYAIMVDTMLGTKVTEQIAEMETKYETEKKEKEIQLLNNEKALSDLKLQTAQQRNWGLGIGLFVLSLLSMILFSLFQKLKGKNKIIEKTNREKDTLLREIHHRVKNNLQVISSLLSLQSKYISDDNALDALKQGKDRVQSMALIHQDLYQTDNLKGVNTQEYFEQLVDNLFDSYKVSDEEIELQMEVEPIMLDVDTMIPLGLVINELVSNSLKHAFKSGHEGKIIVRLQDLGNQLKLEVADNGQGMDDITQLETKSFGYELIKAFAQKLKADIDIKHSNGFSIQLKIYNYKIAV